MAGELVGQEFFSSDRGPNSTYLPSVLKVLPEVESSIAQADPYLTLFIDGI